MHERFVKKIMIKWINSSEEKEKRDQLKLLQEFLEWNLSYYYFTYYCIGYFTYFNAPEITPVAL